MWWRGQNESCDSERSHLWALVQLSCFSLSVWEGRSPSCWSSHRFIAPSHKHDVLRELHALITGQQLIGHISSKHSFTFGRRRPRSKRLRPVPRQTDHNQTAAPCALELMIPNFSYELDRISFSSLVLCSQSPFLGPKLELIMAQHLFLKCKNFGVEFPKCLYQHPQDLFLKSQIWSVMQKSMLLLQRLY